MKGPNVKFPEVNVATVASVAALRCFKQINFKYFWVCPDDKVHLLCILVIRGAGAPTPGIWLLGGWLAEWLMARLD